MDAVAQDRLVFCTYFDERYLARGLALYGSLQRHSPGSLLWALCLSNACEETLQRLNLPNLRILPLQVLEQHDPELFACKASRSIVEYYFTCTPCLTRFVLTASPGCEWVAYLDSDLYFFSDSAAIFFEASSASVLLTPHRFTPASFRSHGKYGQFNVGLVAFRQDDRGRACLEWWRAKCIEWCGDFLDGDRYADQKYLEQFGALFDGVHALNHPGMNLAPWNIGAYPIGGALGSPRVGKDEVIFFHFQGLRRIWRHRYDSNLTGYGARLTAGSRNLIYAPYVAELEAIEGKLYAGRPGGGVGYGVRKVRSGWRGVLQRSKDFVRSVIAVIAGNTVRSGGRPPP